MFSKSQIALLVVAAVAVVEGFAPVAQSRTASSTELGAFFFQKPTEGSPTLSVEPESKNPFAKFSFGKKEAATDAKKAPVKKVVAKKAPVKKVVAKKVVAKKVVAKKAPVKKVVAKKSASKPKLIIYERQCHIN